MIYIFLTIIILELGILNYLTYKRLPDEERKEVIREAFKKVGIKSEGRVIEWLAKEDETSKASRLLTEELTEKK